MEEKQKEQQRKNDGYDDGFYAKNGGVPTYSLTVQQSFITIISYTILPLHLKPKVSTFESHLTLLSWSFRHHPKFSHLTPTMNSYWGTVMVVFFIIDHGYSDHVS